MSINQDPVAAPDPAADSNPSRTPSPPSPRPALKSHLGQELFHLFQRDPGAGLSVGDVVNRLGARGMPLAILLLAAPFVVIPVPGVSTAFGVVFFVMGVCLMFGLQPWLPGFVARRMVADTTLSKIVSGADRVLRPIEKLAKPRMEWVTSKALYPIHGITMLSATFLFALPIPIPFNNTPFALCMVLLALGLLERDGVMTLVALVYNILLWVFLLIFSYLLIQALQEVWAKLSKFF